ncbi:hypothetical protein BC937DRAFT_87957 [Endogone sp. FLAS-F59071]|nr:hypothetical protein BC937DRAFT_87957 [Endogone sp. FLAS-F59071]|eukprot:RUS19134.1 hypothetical protein BC937DRAFT_87957 [Endogone sp. FLAS-F59071]
MNVVVLELIPGTKKVLKVRSTIGNLLSLHFLCSRTRDGNSNRRLEPADGHVLDAVLALNLFRFGLPVDLKFEAFRIHGLPDLKLERALLIVHTLRFKHVLLLFVVENFALQLPSNVANNERRVPVLLDIMSYTAST